MSKKTTIGEDLSEVELNAKKEQEFQQKMLQYIDSVVSMGLLHNSMYSILNFLNLFFFKYSLIT